MIRCNLAVLLAEQNLKITKVALDTGISRTTLTSLANNRSQGIQLDTMNTLCLYLKITPDRLFSFYPVDICILDFKVEKIQFDMDCYIVSVKIYERKIYHQVELYGVLRKIENNESAYTFTINMYSSNCENFSLTQSINLFKMSFEALPQSFKNDLEDNILEKIFPQYDKDIIIVEWNFGPPDYLPF